MVDVWGPSKPGLPVAAGAPAGVVASTFVWRPGGVSGGNVYVTWATLIAAINSAEGMRFVSIDASLGAAQVPAGDHTFSGSGPVIIHGAPIEPPTTITFLDGATINRGGLLPEFHSITVSSVSTAPIMQLGATRHEMILREGATLQALAAPFFELDDAASVLFGFIVEGANIIDAGSPVIHIADANATFELIFGFATSLAIDVLSAIPGPTAILIAVSPSAQISTTQTGFLGALIFQNQDLEPHMNVGPRAVVGPLAHGVVATDGLLLCNPSAGHITINLPPVSTREGRPLIVKRIGTSVNNVNVVPNGADLIDGVNAQYPIVPLNAARRFVASRAAPITGWWVTGAYIPDRPGGMYYVSTPATTTVAVAGTPVKIAGTTSQGPLNTDFVHTNNRLTYQRSDTRLFAVTVVLSATATTNNLLWALSIAKNGGVIVGSPITRKIATGVDQGAWATQFDVFLTLGDYIEAFMDMSGAAGPENMVAQEMIVRVAAA